MEIKENYKKKLKKSFWELEKYFDFTIDIDSSINYDSFCSLLRTMIDIINSNNAIYRVWCLYGKNSENDNWECLQVAESKNIFSEIETDIKFLIEEDYDNLINKAKEENITLKLNKSCFYTDIYCTPEKCSNYEQRRYCYSNMKKRGYRLFKVCVLNTDKYLNIERFEYKNSYIYDIVLIAKYNYAEALLAYDTLAVYWNKVNGKVDGDSIMLFIENRRNMV